MSRRPPNPAADRAAQNLITIKSLLKLEGNKMCADCKRNKHPRWASWNLGIFICIRCSGIHRGMGTHISRVKSVDLDAWTDEQLRSVVQWGNARANRYWEAKLAAGHVPSEAKIENFIRTKYESKRWVMEGPMPDPSELDGDGGEAAEDNVPLSVVKEKVMQETKAAAAASRATGPSQVRRAPQPDLFAADDDVASAPRASSASGISARPPPKAEAAPPKSTKPGDSLLGLDFFGGNGASGTNRPASAAAVSGGQSRPDLKQSILSLYASAPKPQPASQPTHAPAGSIGGAQSSTASQLGGMDDAFSGLSFGGATTAQSQQSSSLFSGLGSTSSNQYKPAATFSPPPLSGGNFFDPKPAIVQHKRDSSSTSGFGAFDSAPVAQAKPAPSSGLEDLFGFSNDPVPSAPPPQPMSTTMAPSVFNLTPASQPTVPAAAKPAAAMDTMSGWSSSDAWGTSSSDAWSNNASTTRDHQSPTTNTTSSSAAAAPSSIGDLGGWGSMSMSGGGGGGSLANQSIVPGATGGGFSTMTSLPPKVAADEDFGGWNSAVPVAGGGSGGGSGGGAGHAAVPKPANGFGGSEDLFSNVWE